MRDCWLAMAKLRSTKFNYNYCIEFLSTTLQTVGVWLVISIEDICKIYSDLQE
jgi:hypothetical protein